MQEKQSWAPIADVAAAYGVSIDTIRRKMKRGELQGRREQTPQGFRWLAPLPDAIERKTAPDAVGSPRTSESPLHDLVIVQRGQEELIDTLRHELAIRNREISRLHEVIASQALGNSPRRTRRQSAPKRLLPMLPRRASAPSCVVLVGVPITDRWLRSCSRQKHQA